MEAVAPVPRAYPGLKDAALLLLLTLGVSVIAQGGLLAAKRLGVDPAHPGAQAVATLFVFAVVVAYGVRRTGAPWRTVLPLRPVPLSLLLPMAVAVLGVGILLSEADNLLRSVLPPPAWLERMFADILKREVNDNVSDSLAGFLAGDAVLEATPAYQQVRNILYSIADKTVISPKIKGSQKVQIPATLLEDNKVEAKDVNGKMAYTSDTLNFYRDEDGKRVCEIMVGRWFDNSFTEGMTDEELLKYFDLNNKLLTNISTGLPERNSKTSCSD